MTPPVTPLVTPPTTPPVTPAPSVTFTATSVALSGNNVTGVDVVLDESVGINVANDPVSGVWTRTTTTGARLFSDINVVWQSHGQGKLQLKGRPAASLGAGSYSSVVKLEVCLDSLCAQQVTGSPVNIPVTYVVTGGLLPSTQVTWSETPLVTVQMNTFEQSSPKITLRVSVLYIPLEGLWLRRTSAQTGVITNVEFIPEATFVSTVGGSYAIYNVTLKPPAALGSGVFTDNMFFEACFDSACATPVPGSLYNMSISMNITATDGVEFRRGTLAPANGATNVVWSEQNQSLYLLSSAFASNGPLVGTDPKITRVNPLTMATGASTTLAGENILPMAITPDGSYLYLGSKTKAFVHRLQLPSLALDLSVPLDTSGSSSSLLANDLAMIPGQPQSFVAALKQSSNVHAGLFVYDNAIARPASVGVYPGQAFASAQWLVPASAPGNYVSLSYGASQPVLNSLDQLTVGAGGIGITASTPFGGIGLVRFFDKPRRAGTRLYTTSGHILDAGTGALLGALALPNSLPPYAVLPDESKGRIFVWTEVNSVDVVRSYDISTLQYLGQVPVYGVAHPASLGVRNMILWGSDGVAMTDGVQLVVLSGPFFTSYRGP